MSYILELELEYIIVGCAQVKEMGQLMDTGDMLSDCIMGCGSINAMDFYTQKQTEYAPPEYWNAVKAKELFWFAYNKIAEDLVTGEKRKSKTVSKRSMMKRHLAI